MIRRDTFNPFFETRVSFLTMLDYEEHTDSADTCLEELVWRQYDTRTYMQSGIDSRLASAKREK